MSRAFAMRPLAAALTEEGLVPEECGDIEILMPTDGVVMLSYRVFVRVEDLEKLSRAFARAAVLQKPPVELPCRWCHHTREQHSNGRCTAPGIETGICGCQANDNAYY